MPGQPYDPATGGFDVAMVIPTEPVGATAPAFILAVGDSVTLKTYMHVDQSVQNILKSAINSAITGANGKVEYHLQDLETGAMVPTTAGGKPTKLSTTDARIALGLQAGPATNPCVVDGELSRSGLPATGDFYVSCATAPITTGKFSSGATLQLSSVASESGTWRVLAHCHGGAGSDVSAFDDDLLIQVIA